MAHKRFGLISKIVPEIEKSWKWKTFLTFDIDWAHDIILHDSLKLVRDAQVRATWFATHDTPFLSEIQQNNCFEIGIHPNFNPLLSGDNSISSHEVISSVMSIVQNPKSVRSHSLVQSERLVDNFGMRG